jgi:uncharacterized phage protein gp47/JayE
MSIAALAYIDSTGYHYSDYPTVLQYFQDQYRAIYGADVYLEADSQDGQWLAVLAQAVYDSLALGAATYSSYSPSTAQGEALSRDVKINGMRRNVASSSSVDLTIVGQAGTTINLGQAEGEDGTKWNLPDSVVIPPGGSITVTALADVKGAVSAGVGTITKIATPTRGWQTVNNPTAANIGDPVETDGELRIRQTQSVALPSRTVLEGIQGAIASITGVSRVRVYENDTNATDTDGLPPHSIAAIVEGGDINTIAATIAAKKTPGGYTHGSIPTVVINSYGLPITIRASRPSYDTITPVITIKALAGYNTSVGDSIIQAVADYINGVAIGGGESKSVEWGDAITAANSVPANATFKITAFTLAGPGGPGSPDVPIAYDHASQCDPLTDITLNVT